MTPIPIPINLTLDAIAINNLLLSRTCACIKERSTSIGHKADFRFHVFVASPVRFVHRSTPSLLVVAAQPSALPSPPCATRGHHPSRSCRKPQKRPSILISNVTSSIYVLDYLRLYFSKSPCQILSFYVAEVMLFSTLFIAMILSFVGAQSTVLGIPPYSVLTNLEN
jgi:hypothetical protein